MASERVCRFCGLGGGAHSDKCDAISTANYEQVRDAWKDLIGSRDARISALETALGEAITLAREALGLDRTQPVVGVKSALDRLAKLKAVRDGKESD